MGKLFKGGHYLRVDTNQGNTVLKTSLCFWIIIKNMILNFEILRLNVQIHSVKWVIWLGVILLVCLPHPIQCQVEDLCNVSGCSCNTLSDDLIEVNCQCSTGQVRLILLFLAFFGFWFGLFLVLYLASGSRPQPLVFKWLVSDWLWISQTQLIRFHIIFDFI